MVESARVHIVQLRWILRSLDVALFVRLLKSDDFQAHIRGFLRIHIDGGKPAEQMPTWIWLCGLCGRDVRELLLSNSEHLRVLVRDAFKQATLKWLKDLNELLREAKKCVQDEDLRSLANASIKPCVCTKRVSETYLEILMLEFKILLSANELQPKRPQGNVHSSLPTSTCPSGQHFFRDDAHEFFCCCDNRGSFEAEPKCRAAHACGLSLPPCALRAQQNPSTSVRVSPH